MEKEREQTISTSDLKEILAEQARQYAEQTKEIITALKQPSVVEQQKLDAEKKEIELRNQERKDNSAAMLQKIENDRMTKLSCTHQHQDGNSHCVLVTEKRGPGYILCQKNQCIIRPGPKPEGYVGTDIYDTALFNRQLQGLPTAELFG